MPQIFRPYADTVVRSVLLAILVVPFLTVGIAYWISASEYVTGRSITSISRCRSATSIMSAALGSIAATATPVSRPRRSPACRRPRPA